MPGDVQGALGGGEGAGQQRIGHACACGAIGIGVEGGQHTVLHTLVTLPLTVQ